MQSLALWIEPLVYTRDEKESAPDQGVPANLQRVDEATYTSTPELSC